MTDEYKEFIKTMSGDELVALHKRLNDLDKVCEDIVLQLSHDYKSPFNMCQYYIKHELMDRVFNA